MFVLKKIMKDNDKMNLTSFLLSSNQCNIYKYNYNNIVTGLAFDLLLEKATVVKRKLIVSTKENDEINVAER